MSSKWPLTRKRFIMVSLFTLLVYAIAPFLHAEKASAAVQASYYVAPNGSDTNPGTLGAPFRTLDKARQVVRTINGNMSGDIIVNFRGGQYPFAGPVSFDQADSGTNGYRVYYQAYQDEVPVFNGGTKVTGWTQTSGNIYQATLTRSSKLRTLYVNGKRAIMARGSEMAPQGGDGTYTINGTESWALSSGSTYSGIKFNASDLGSYARPSDVELVNQVGFSFHIIGLSDLATSGSYRVAKLQMPMGAIALSEPQAWGMAFYQYNNNPANHFYVQNAYELLDQPGEFYFNRTTNTLYYYKRSNEDMSKAEVYAPTSEGMLRLSGTSQSSRVHHIVFQGIKFANDHWSLMNVAGSVGATTVQANALYNKFVSGGNWHQVAYRNTDVMPATVKVESASDIQFIRNGFEHLGAGAITFGNDTVNSSIVGNRFTDISGSAITIGDPLNTYIGDGDFAANREGAPTNITVQNNAVNTASVEFLQTVPVMIYYTVNLNLSNNLIVNSPYSAISLGWGWSYFAGYEESGVTPINVASGNTIANNRVLSSMKLMHDGGAIYTIGKQTGTRITGNFLSDIGGVSYGNAIYTDQASSQMEIDHNVLENYNGAWWTVWGTAANVSQLNVHDNYVDYATGTEGAYASNTTRTNNVTEPNSPPWSTAAQSIINNSGLQTAYRDIATVKSTVFEAENGIKFGRAAVYDDTGAANGQGALYLDLNGDGLQFDRVPAATQLTIKYATPNAGNYSLYVNGVKTSISFASTGGWYAPYGTKVVPIDIPEGASLKFQHDTGDIGLNLDQISVSYGNTVLEAEWGIPTGRAAVYGDASASGGQGVQYLDLNGDALQFNNVPAATKLTLKYASASAGTYSLYVNGAKTSLSIPSTGSWYGAYGTKTISISIPSGATLKLQHDSGDTGMNLDALYLQ
ncbi:hypothetical protein D7Z26_19160 [Cohnella endophytica]|uniref:CBM6 domain-containing protein n=1 Tax=Cohnella endophytica TaxID=2419778 RepID=A0A494XGS2_9BACL|nr:hypothetical protein [Cohnella endophytica]RKP49945.1 hypothetical protein D7Z26_19160 [Cohnella endophytica]